MPTHKSLECSSTGKTLLEERGRDGERKKRGKRGKRGKDAIFVWHDSILENLGKFWKSCCFCFIFTSQHKNGVVPSLAKSFYPPSIGQDFCLGPRLLAQSWKKESFFE
jgi:hypothetical protein